jgi:hypothetical protein
MEVTIMLPELNTQFYNARNAILLLVALGLAACAIASRSLPLPEHLIRQDVASAELNLEALRKGRALAVTECMDCHRFFWPEEYTPSEWREIIRRMAPLSSLTKEQAMDLARYMEAASLFTSSTSSIQTE